MSWRGSTSALDRFFACLPYLLPLMYSLSFGGPLFRQIPALRYILIPLAPLELLYGMIPFAGIVVFFALFFLVIRNERVAHFIRFNTTQAILVSFILFLLQLILPLIQPLLGRLLLETFFSIIFLGTIAIVVYSIAQSIMGRYAEIPTLSDAAYSQVR
jgi:uncharacterized membrane protein